MNSDPDKFLRSSMEEGSDFDINEIEENMANLENIIAAGASASNKRHLSKKYSADSNQITFQLKFNSSSDIEASQLYRKILS